MPNQKELHLTNIHPEKIVQGLVMGLVGAALPFLLGCGLLSTLTWDPNEVNPDRPPIVAPTLRPLIPTPTITPTLPNRTIIYQYP